MSYRPEQKEFSGPWWRFPIMQDALRGGAVIAVTWMLGHLVGLDWIEPFGYTAAMIFGGNHFVREGLEELWREREVGIEILMGAAAVGAAALGLWDEAALLVFLYAAAEALEEYAYARTRSAIRGLWIWYRRKHLSFGMGVRSRFRPHNFAQAIASRSDQAR